MDKRRAPDPASWLAGCNTGLSGGPPVCPPEVPDSLAYYSGYIEGSAAARAAGRDDD